MIKRIVAGRWPLALLVAIAFVVVCKDLAGGTSERTTLTYNGWLRAFAAGRLVLVTIALLILTKPSLSREDRLLFGGIIGLSLEIFWEFVPDPLFWPAAILAQVAVAYGMAQLIRYAIARGRDDATNAVIERVAPIIAVTIALAGLAPIVLGFGQWIDGRQLDDATFLHVAPWLDRVRWFAMLAACVAIGTAAVNGLRRADADARPRALFIVISFAPLVLATSLHALVHVAGAHEAAWAKDADAVGNVLTAAGLAYGVLSRRLVDIEYALTVTITFGIAAAALAVLAFAGEHFVVPAVAERVASIPLFVPYGEEVRSATHVIVAFAVFLLISAIHEKATSAVRSVLFGRREEHLRALRDLADNAVQHARPKAVAQKLVEAAVVHASSTHAALYERDGTAFRLVAEAGSSTSRRSHVSGDDRSVPPLRRAHILDDGAVTLPMPIGTALQGFLWCARKHNGLAYAPDEIAALGLATREVGLVLATRPAP